MKQHLEAYAVREAGQQTYWTRIGVAFPNKRGFSVLLDAMPAPRDGRFTIVVLPPKAEQSAAGTVHHATEAGHEFRTARTRKWPMGLHPSPTNTARCGTKPKALKAKPGSERFFSRYLNYADFDTQARCLSALGTRQESFQRARGIINRNASLYGARDKALRDHIPVDFLRKYRQCTSKAIAAYCEAMFLGDSSPRKQLLLKEAHDHLEEMPRAVASETRYRGEAKLHHARTLLQLVCSVINNELKETV